LKEKFRFQKRYSILK